MSAFQPGNTIGRLFEAGNTLSRRHGHTSMDKNGKVKKSLTYQTWSNMNDRCYNDHHRYFKDYGQRGIEVCERWRRGTKDAFLNFLADMGERPAKEITLDRIDVNGNYEKIHSTTGAPQCAWADKATQRANQRPPTKH